MSTDMHANTECQQNLRTLYRNGGPTRTTLDYLSTLPESGSDTQQLRVVDIAQQTNLTSTQINAALSQIGQACGEAGDFENTNTVSFRKFDPHWIGMVASGKAEGLRQRKPAQAAGGGITT
jgi:hypothetical protein